jgi:hypothetical protein
MSSPGDAVHAVRAISASSTLAIERAEERGRGLDRPRNITTTLAGHAPDRAGGMSFPRKV